MGKPIQIELTCATGVSETAMARVRLSRHPAGTGWISTTPAALPSIEWRINVDQAQAAIYARMFPPPVSPCSW